jgi:biopolymer transport protein ExbB/TolQ
MKEKCNVILAAEYSLVTDWAGLLLIGYSIVGLALILERVVSWRRLRKVTGSLAGPVQEGLKSPDRQAMRSLFERVAAVPVDAKGKARKVVVAPLAWVMTYVLKHDVSDSPETTQMLLDDALEDTSSRLKKNLVYLASLAGTAPFLGLLGTVVGIMNTFISIRDKGLAGGPEVISAGIAQALQTTAMGLLIAIPTFIAYNLFNHKANEHVRELRMQANRILVALGEM